jgi:hypothetical protein
MENKVRNNKQEGRFELALEGGQAAYVEYEEAGDGVLALTRSSRGRGSPGRSSRGRWRSCGTRT